VTPSRVPLVPAAWHRRAGLSGTLSRSSAPLLRPEDSRTPPPSRTWFSLAILAAGRACARRSIQSGNPSRTSRNAGGFDCLYGMGQEADKKNGTEAVADDATFWADWMSGNNARPLDIFYGPSTLYQSVKLDLIGQGKATAEGNKANPPG